MFLMAHAGHARNFEWTLRELAARKHRVTVAIDSRGQMDDSEPLGTIVRELDHVEVVAAPPVCGVLHSGARRLRLVRDYARFFQSPFSDAEALRARAGGFVPASALARRVLTLEGPRSAVDRVTSRIERRINPPREVVQFIENASPDALLVTPLVEFGSPQVDYVRAAAQLRIPSALLVASWDNLTVKGSLHVTPDLVAVWNELQLREAVDLHGVPESRVTITGAVAFDHWFDWRPGRSEAEFRRELGLDPRLPIVLYVGSSRFTAPDEGDFLVEWARAIADHEIGRGVQLLVRPHPENPLGRAGETVRDMEGVVVYPPSGQNPTTAVSRRDYYDTLRMCKLVVGVNTTAFIEAAIVGRPSYTLLAERYRDTQVGTLHFHYLLSDNGGPVTAARSLSEHIGQLRMGLTRSDSGVEVATRRFVESFVRPQGFEYPASSALVDAIENLQDPRAAARALPTPPQTVGGS
jgi:hypothetical protein